MKLEGIIELIVKLLGITEEQQRLLARLAWIFFVTFHIFWVCGWLTWAGLTPPFMTVAEAQTLSSKVDALTSEIHHERVERLSQEVQTVRSLQCHALKTQNWEAAQLYQQRMNWLLDRYKEVAHDAYIVPECGP